MWSNRNTEGRKENINKEYKAGRDVLKGKIDQTEDDEVKSSLQLQKQKNEFSHRTAIINEEINEKLKMLLENIKSSQSISVNNWKLQRI